MLIVFNPAAGGRRRRRLARALEALGLQGLRPDVAETSRPGHAAELAREAAGRGVGMVVAAGGDGTVAEVASGLAGSAALLGILPFGTANVLAWELGLPPAPERAARVLTGGRAAVLRPGLARFGDGTERLFVQMVGAGFDAAVVANLDLGLKRRVGKAAYVAQAARELVRYPFPAFTAALDGGEGEPVASAIVTKGRLYAGRHLLAPGAAPGQRGFRVALFRGGGPLRAALYGAALPFDLLPRLPGVEIRCASRVRLLPAPGPAVPAQADGDPAGALPVEIEDAAETLRVVLPPVARGPGGSPVGQAPDADRWRRDKGWFPPEWGRGGRKIAYTVKNIWRISLSGFSMRHAPIQTGAWRSMPMTDFVIVIAAAAMLSNPVPGPGATASTPGTATAPLTAPTVGFRTYPDAASCEQATAAQVAPAGARLVCVPVEPALGGSANAY